MSDQPANILLLEDVTTVQFFVRNALCALPKPYTLFTAGSLAQARDIIVDKAIDLFIVDIGLPDGDGIDFLCEAAILHPQATAIIVTATPTEEHRARAEQLGIVQLLSKPIQREKLVASVKKMMGWSDQPGDTSNFRATLSGLTPMDIIQLKCMSGSTSILEFSNTQGTGRVFFEKGDIIHSLLRSANGETLIGYEAFEEIVNWKNGRVAEVLDDNPPPRTIRANWQSLLLEVAQSHDEIQGRAA